MELPFDMFKNIIENDALVVESEDVVFNLIVKYIESRENEKPSPSNNKN